MSDIKENDIFAYNRNRETALFYLGMSSIIPVFLAAVAPVKYYMDMPDIPDTQRAHGICIEETWSNAAKPEIDKKFILSEDIRNCAADKIAAANTAEQHYIDTESPLTRTDNTTMLQSGLVSAVFWFFAGASALSNIRLRKQYPDIAKAAKTQRQTAKQESPSPA